MAANASGESTPAAAPVSNEDKFTTFDDALITGVVRSGLSAKVTSVLHAAMKLLSASQIPADAYESAEALAKAANKAVSANIDAAIRDNHASVKRASNDDRAAARSEVAKLVKAAVNVVIPPTRVKPEFKDVVFYPLREVAPPTETVVNFGAWQYAKVDEGRKAGFHPGDGRRPYGTLVLGPSGSGKSAFLEHELRGHLQQAAANAPVAAVVANLGDVLGKGPDWYCRGTAEERADEARGILGERVCDMVLDVLDRHTLTTSMNVAVCLDEVGILPGLLSKKKTWKSVAQKVYSISDMTKYKGMIRGVHVAAAGTAAESGVQQPLASNLSEITKLRLAQWTPATVLRTICSENNSDSAALKAIVGVLCGEPHGIVSAMSNARMAVATLRQVVSDKFLPLAWDGSEVHTTYVRNQRSYLLRHVVEAYCSQNGLANLFRAVASLPAKHEDRGILRGVGLGALWVTMRQRTASAQTSAGEQEADGDDDGGGTKTEAQELEAVCAHAAEHFGLIASNAGKHVGDGELPYQMHAGTVLVALHLMGLDVTELPANWRALEELVALHESVTAAGEFLLSKGRFAAKPAGVTLPTALQGADLPLATKPIYPPLVWDRRTAPTHIGSTARVILPLDVPCNVMAQDKGPFADVMGHRRISQAKDKLATTEAVRAADIPAEMAKAGLLQPAGADNAAPPATNQAGNATAASEASAAAATPAPDAAAAEAKAPVASTKAKNQGLQQRVLDALLRQWKKYEDTCGKKAKRTAASFAPGTSRLGDRHLYPLGLLLPIESLSPAPFQVYADTGPETAFKPWCVAGTAFPPSEPRKTPDAQPPQRAAGADAPPPTTLRRYRRWCEFRMVVTDLGKVALGGGDDGKRVSHTLAVFVRRSTEMPWTMEHGGKRMETAVLPRLREDMALTLLAVTVTHVCDAAGLSKRAQEDPARTEHEEEPLQQPSRRQPLSPEKK